MRHTLTFVLGLLLLPFLSADPARAASILVTGDTTFKVEWLYVDTDPDLKGEAVFTITNFDSNSGFDLRIDQIKNTTATSPDINARLTHFGFGLTPDATSFSSLVDSDVFTWDVSNFPVFQQVDICGTAGETCAGGGNGGLGQGQSIALDDFMSVRVNGTFLNGVTFSPIPVKFQTQPNSYEFDGQVICINGSCDEPFNPNPVPEPATLSLLGLGLAALVYSRRRARSSRA